MKTRQELEEQLATLKRGLYDGLAGMSDVYAFIDLLMDELESCHNQREDS